MYEKTSDIYTAVLDMAFELLLEDEELSETEKIDQIDDAITNASNWSYEDDDEDDYTRWSTSGAPFKSGRSNYEEKPVVVKDFEITQKLFILSVSSKKQGYTETSHELRILHKDTRENITDKIQEKVKITPAPIEKNGDCYYLLSSINLLRVIGFLKY